MGDLFGFQQEADHTPLGNQQEEKSYSDL